VLPGNREYAAGDRIPRPDGVGGPGNATESGEGDSEDALVFSLSREEFMQIFFDDLELPNLARTEVGRAERQKTVRAGYAKTGTPANLAVIRTLSQSLARRIALGGGLTREMQAVEAEFALAVAVGQSEHAAKLYGELKRLERRRAGLSFLEEPDLRYRNRVLRPEPIARAAMFCLMDVSASMDEDKKDLAKRFFTLLYLFLTRKYGEVELIFIRHTDNAEEVDENTFFHDSRTGGTVVLSALELADRIRYERFRCRPGPQCALSSRAAPPRDALLHVPRAVDRAGWGARFDALGRIWARCGSRRQLRDAPRLTTRPDLSGVPRLVP